VIAVSPVAGGGRFRVALLDPGGVIRAELILGPVMGLRGSSKLLKRTGLADLVRDAMELERRTMELYCRFETVFTDSEPVRIFWLDMAEHESRHVGALTLVAGLLESETLRQLPVVPPAAKGHVARLGRLLDDIES